jgi:hypothetical protein
MTSRSTHAFGFALILMTALLGACNERTPVFETEVVTAPSSVPPNSIPRAAAGIVDLTFSPPGDRGGTTGFGTISLDSPAPDGGIIVSLQSTNESIVSVPKQVVVPAGALSTNFEFTTRTVTREINVTINASSDERLISNFVSVWTPTTQFLSYTADRPGFANPGPTTRSSSDAGTRFEAFCFGSSVSTTVDPPGTSLFGVSFGAPQGQPFTPGIYEDATEVQSRNFMSISAAGNCGPIGRFEVREIETRADGTIRSLWVAFEQSCRQKPGILRGAFQITNAVPRPNQRCFTR